MTTAILPKERVFELLDALMRDYEVIAPVRSGGDTLFVQIDDAEEATLEYSNSSVSLKDFLFPQRERIFQYLVRRGTFEVKMRPDRRRRLIFGIRPCDVAGFRYLDAAYGGDIVDPIYWTRRANTKLVCIACTEPCTDFCFCTSTDTGPFPTTGFDLALVPTRHGFLTEAPTEAGEGILRSGRRFFEPSTKSALIERETQAAGVQEKFGRGVDIQRAVARMKLAFRDSVWENTAKKCLRCGGCTYVCPTCYCFDICDKPQNSTGERLRHWDSCQLIGFGRRAGGLNARPTQADRLRQWYYHKFSYSLDQFGMLGCVGCGRCVETCIGNIDVVRVLSDLMER